MLSISSNIEQIFNSIPPFYNMLSLGRFNSPDKAVDLTITVEHGGCKIKYNFTNGNKYTALVYNPKHYYEELHKLKNRAYADLERAFDFTARC